MFSFVNSFEHPWSLAPFIRCVCQRQLENSVPFVFLFFLFPVLKYQKQICVTAQLFCTCGLQLLLLKHTYNFFYVSSPTRIIRTTYVGHEGIAIV